MSTVWGTKYRLLLEELEQLANWLSADKPREPRVVEIQTVRLLMGMVLLLRQHQVNKRGQCRFCRWPQGGWPQGGWSLWRRRPRCTVYRALDFAMGQPLDVVWWQLCAGTGRDTALTEVRRWLEQRDQAAREAGGSKVNGDGETR